MEKWCCDFIFIRHKSKRGYVNLEEKVVKIVCVVSDEP